MSVWLKFYSRHAYWVWGAVAVGAALNIAHHLGGVVGIDFEVFRKTGARVLAGEVIYQPNETMPYKYAPVFALAFTALSLLPPLPTFYLWNALGGLALAYLIVWGSQALPERWRLVGSLLAFFTVLTPIQQHFSLGQIDALLFAAVAGSEALRKRAPVLSGALLAFAALTKITFVAFIIVALFFFEKRRALGIAAGMALGLLAPIAFFGPAQTAELTQSWLHLLGASLEPWICWRDNQGAFGIACVLGYPPASPAHMRAGYAISLLALVPCGAVVLYKLYKRQPVQRSSVLFSIFMTFFLSPLGWFTSLLGLIPLLQVVIAKSQTPPRAMAALPVLALAVLARGAMGHYFVPYAELRIMGLLALWLCWLFAYYVATTTEDV